MEKKTEMERDGDLNADGGHRAAHVSSSSVVVAPCADESQTGSCRRVIN